ncbi:MAG: carbamate kinase, partial [Elusimicrobiota bacterium]|nr:carbamate kinase [Elusimicrobiota bacterium]
NPSKPIGSFMSKDEAGQKKTEEGWDMTEDAGRGYRRVVPSPTPKKIIEEGAIKLLAENGYTVIAVGGGGIPVYQREDGIIAGIEAVIDKDAASSLLATSIGADLFMVSTAVDKVCLNFDKPDQKDIDSMDVATAKKYIKEGQFAPGSMLPKIESAIKYLENGGNKAIITSPEVITDSLEGKNGTVITP